MRGCGLLCSPGLSPSPSPPQTGGPPPHSLLPACQTVSRGHPGMYLSSACQHALHPQHHHGPMSGEFESPSRALPLLWALRKPKIAQVKPKQKQKPKPTSWQHSLPAVSPGSLSLAVGLPQMKCSSQNGVPLGPLLRLEPSSFLICRLSLWGARGRWGCWTRT